MENLEMPIKKVEDADSEKRAMSRVNNKFF